MWKKLFDELTQELSLPVRITCNDNMRVKYRKMKNTYIKIINSYVGTLYSKEIVDEISIICDKINAAWLQYLKGNVESSNSMIRNLLNRKFIASSGRLIDKIRKTVGNEDGDPIVEEIKGNFKNLYRIRLADGSPNFTMEDLFHIPYDARQLVSAQRYSIQGFPILYLGTTIDGCRTECGIKNNGSAYVSEFEILYERKELYVANLATMPSDLKRYIEEKSISQENINEYLINYIYIFPFMLACNFAIDYNGQLQFRNEYVIPQLITHALRNISCKGKEKMCCIRYLSVKNEDCINYAFFSPEIRVKERYSNYLTNIMIWCIPEPLVNGKISCTGKKNAFNYKKTRKENF